MYVQYIQTDDDGRIRKVRRQLQRRPAPRGDGWQLIDHHELSSQLQAAPEKFFAIGTQVFLKPRVKLHADPSPVPTGRRDAVRVTALNDRGEEIEVNVLVGMDEVPARTPLSLGWEYPGVVEIDLNEPQMWGRPLYVEFTDDE